jgi:acetyltransferase-like isoleucine patch superfamily enzyme
MISISDTGLNNNIQIDETYHISQFNLSVEGSDNRIICHKPFHVTPQTRIDIWVSGDRNNINIGAIYANALRIHCANEFDCDIGDGTSINEAYIATNEPASLKIGKNCLFATEVKIYPTDFHKIFADGRRINPPRPIVVGDKVWLCERVMVLSGAEIGNGCVIGAAAVVAGQVPRRSVAVGNPAYVVRSDIEWGP